MLMAVGAPASEAATTRLDYQCTFPLVGEVPVTVDLDTSIPGAWPANTTTDASTVRAVVSAGGSAGC